MATRKRTTTKSSPKRKKQTISIELTRLKLLYGLSGIFTLCVVGLMLARPVPLQAEGGISAALAARSQDPVDIAIETDSSIDPVLWKQIIIERVETLSSASEFHFAVLPQRAGDQIAVMPEWGRQSDFSSTPGALRIVLVSSDPALDPAGVKTVRVLVERLRDRLRMTDAAVLWPAS